MNLERLEHTFMEAPIVSMILIGLALFTACFIYHFGEVSGELHALQLQILKQEAKRER